MVAFLVLLSTITTANSIGRVPDGPFSSGESTSETLEDAREHCDEDISCAGITYRPNEDEEEEHEWTVYFHSFLPPLLNNNEEHDWITERNEKDFVLHPGKLLTAKPAGLDLAEVEPSLLTLQDAEKLCKNHPECVAFSYPINSSQLVGFDDIVFSTSLEGLDTTHENWQTFVINQANKAYKINSDVMFYDQDMKEHPYSTCCYAATINALPTIQQVQAMDSKLRRISCNISSEDFLQEYEFTRTPVMLVGCDDDWPAKTEWTFKKLSERFENDDTTTWKCDDGHLPWTEIMKKVGQNKSVYIFDDLDDEAKLSIEDDYSWPKPFVGKDLYPEDFPPGFGSRHWIGLGEKGSGTIPHTDPCGTDAWNSKTNMVLSFPTLTLLHILILTHFLHIQVSLVGTSGGCCILVMS